MTLNKKNYKLSSNVMVEIIAYALLNFLVILWCYSLSNRRMCHTNWHTDGIKQTVPCKYIGRWNNNTEQPSGGNAILCGYFMTLVWSKSQMRQVPGVMQVWRRVQGFVKQLRTSNCVINHHKSITRYSHCTLPQTRRHMMPHRSTFVLKWVYA